MEGRWNYVWACAWGLGNAQAGSFWEFDGNGESAEDYKRSGGPRAITDPDHLTFYIILETRCLRETIYETMTNWFMHQFHKKGWLLCRNFETEIS